MDTDRMLIIATIIIGLLALALLIDIWQDAKGGVDDPVMDNFFSDMSAMAENVESNYALSESILKEVKALKASQG